MHGLLYIASISFAFAQKSYMTVEIFPYRSAYLTKCLPHRGVHLSVVSTLQVCPSYRGVCLLRMSSLQGYFSYRGIHFTGVYHLTYRYSF